MKRIRRHVRDSLPMLAGAAVVAAVVAHWGLAITLMLAGLLLFSFGYGLMRRPS